MSAYKIEVDTNRPVPGGMDQLVDAVASRLEELRFREDDYAVVVHGPPELRIVAVDR